MACTRSRELGHRDHWVGPEMIRADKSGVVVRARGAAGLGFVSGAWLGLALGPGAVCGHSDSGAM